mmetsp:Transcript_16449/g.46713  ORF Transcript_16449/g.46713 Transcript_16449/m.46713 type:complete len:240 (+) Transcript_16449:920-1639(+)
MTRSSAWFFSRNLFNLSAVSRAFVSFTTLFCSGAPTPMRFPPPNAFEMSAGRSKTPQLPEPVGLCVSCSVGGAQDPPIPDVVLTAASSSSLRIEPPPPNSASPSFIASLKPASSTFFDDAFRAKSASSILSPSYRRPWDLYSRSSAIFFRTSAIRFARASASGMIVFGRSSGRMARVCVAGRWGGGGAKASAAPASVRRTRMLAPGARIGLRFLSVGEQWQKGLPNLPSLQSYACTVEH